MLLNRKTCTPYFLRLRRFRQKIKKPARPVIPMVSKDAQIQSRKTCTPYFCKKQAHGTRCRRRSVNGTVSRNGSSQFSDAYSCDFKQLDISNLCRKSCKNPCFCFLGSRKTCTPYFSEKSKNVYPLFFQKFPLKSLSDIFYVNFSMSFVAMDSSYFFVILACARARARTHADMFLVSIT